MKELAQEFIKEKGKELVFVSGTILVILAMAFGYSYLIEGGDPYVPEGLHRVESQLDKRLTQGLSITEDVTLDLNQFLELELQGNTAAILSKANEAKAPLAEINSIVSKAAEDIEDIAAVIPQIKPKIAQRALSDALTYAAILGQRLLTFSEQMDSLYVGLETRAKGEESIADYVRLVQEANVVVQEINSLRDQYNASMSQFYELTDA
ncbi:MAG: hypothetical protein WD883_01230 [Candidatus Colwellbacteria bacterium]